MRVKTWEHLWLLDDGYEGCAKTINKLAVEAQGEWFVPLADDDLLLPWFLRRHVDAADGADVVYSPPLVSGEDASQFCMSPPEIPAVALISARLWWRLGGYDEREVEQEDRGFYTRAQQHANARFVRVDEPCWVYRFHGQNKSRGWTP